MEKKITLLVDVPDIGATEIEIYDYLKFEFGDKHSINSNNPYIEKNVNVSVIDCDVEDI